MTILDQYGNPIAQTDLSEAQTDDKARYGSLPKMYESTRQVTPARIAALFRSAEEGDLIGQHYLFAEMEERDAHLYSEMAKRRRSVLTLKHNVLEPADANAAEKAACEWIKSYIDNMNDFEDLCYDLLDAIGHGFANVELSWALVNKVWTINKFEYRPQAWFTTDHETRNTLLLRSMDSQGDPLRPFGWISHVHKSKSGYIARAGLYRVLAWPYMFKHYAVGDWAEFLETYGMPVRVGKYPVGSTDKEKQTLFSAVMALGRNAAATMPETMNVEFMNAASKSQAAHDPFAQMADWADKAMSKAILGGTLTSQADGKTSTNALGTVHNEVREELVVSDARQLAGTLTRDLIYPLLVLNGFNIDFARCPRFAFEVEDVEDVAAMAESLPKLVGMGMEIDIDWAHDKLGIPRSKDGKNILRTGSPAAPEPAGEAAQDAPSPPTPLPKGRGELDGGAKKNAKLSALLAAQMASSDAAHPLDMLDAAPSPDMTQGMMSMLQPIMQAIRDGQTPDEVAEALLQAYPQMDSSSIEETLARAFFVADIWGRMTFDEVNDA